MDIQTQGIKYAGSKNRLLPQILSLAKSTGARSVWDGFSGTTRVSQAFAQMGFRTLSSDLSVWSEIFAQCWLLNRRKPEEYGELISHLNAVPPRDGWFTEHYGGDPEIQPQPNALKKPFQRKNTQKADAIREELDRLQLDPVTRAVALTSLILALDRVDSTLGHFSSYLRQWSRRSFRDLKLELPHLWVNSLENEVHRGDIFSLTPQIQADLAYFDPPYGSNNEKMPPSRVRYAAYYHFWTTLILNDRPALFGKASRREDTSDPRSASIFEEFRKDPQSGRFLAVEAIRRLLAETQTQWILLSYSSGGRATAEELMDALHSVGTLRQFLKLDYRRNVMAEMKWTHEWLRESDGKNQEFLFLIKKKS
ncbi:MAG: DNA adenine methylase [Thermoguttaceae bacterium]|nr:DNA methyltransferase [Planctomycetaceae bacterium]MBQ4143601.1 DNA adenine methylase [Thermoguttaceae bacterium]